MAVVNVTPDSFSSDGLASCSVQEAVSRVEGLVADGADIIDIGGESSRPQARAVPLKEELRRTIPLIKALRRAVKAPISIDTHKPEVARQALDNGAAIVNDITALRDIKMRKVVARYRAAAVLMHMKGTPRTMQRNPVYEDVVGQIKEFLQEAVSRALDAGIKKERLIVDPGIGFGKTLEHNLEILRRLKEFKSLAQPILVGTSRKAFIGAINRTSPQERVFGTLASCILAAENGAQIVRVHDVKAMRQALDVADSIKRI
ncbi:MAG: dihydropteroate synthase [Candidatus Omnitrophica bacterium]|nr:dihydropteroate synthase [Candidatus Omnitrophota bacterium]